MKEFMVHCPDDESRKQARDFFTAMFKGNIVRNQKDRIVTDTGITVVYINSELDTCGHRIEDFLTITNKKEQSIYERLRVCTM